MAKKTKRGATRGRRAKPRTKTGPKAKTGMKAKAVKLFARLSAKVGSKAAKVSSRAAQAGASAKASARRTFRKATTTEHSMAKQLARNKQLVLDFYQKLIGEKDFEAARPYMGDDYRQHAPYAPDGHAGVAAWVRQFKESFPEHHYEVKRIIAEGDLVMLHLHGKSGMHPFGESVIDIFRIKDGKVVEHWDVIQPIPESADNANTMF